MSNATGQAGDLVPVYSIAKTFTAAALLAAKVDLDAAAGQFLDLPAQYRGLVLRDLLHHTSGLGDYFALADYRAAVERRDDAWSDAELLERSLSVPAVRVGHFSYSNIGFTLVRMILERVSGEDFFSALDRLVFTSLGMSEVAPLRTRADWDRCSLASESVRAYDPNWVYPRTFLADVDAIAHGLAGVVRGELFDPTPLLDGVPVEAPGHSFTDPCYGLGIMMDGQSWVGHGGGGPGFVLFALAARDGSRAHLEYQVTDTDQGDAALIAAAMACIGTDQGIR